MSLKNLLTTALAAKGALSSPLLKRSKTPSVASAENVGIATDVYLNRDSCNSVRVGARELWTCRDTQTSDGRFLSSTASWSNFASDGSPDVPFGQLSLYGDNPAEYFPNQPDECGGPAGACPDGTRYAIWPDQPSLPYVNPSDGSYSLYTWIRNSHIQGLTPLDPNPPCSLYKASFDPSQGESGGDLPPVSLVDERFWPEDSIPYGDYGWVVNDGTAYLYGALANNAGQALAKVPVGAIEDRSQYSYYTSAGWQASPPSDNDTSAAIPNAGTGQQGTFYHSDYFGSYVWIGSPSIGDNGVFLLSTAPEPQGPWSDMVQIYQGPNGNSTGLSAYSQQAHPGLSRQGGDGDDIYLTYTKVDNTDTYTTELIHVVWN